MVQEYYNLLRLRPVTLHKYGVIFLEITWHNVSFPVRVKLHLLLRKAVLARREAGSLLGGGQSRPQRPAILLVRDRERRLWGRDWVAVILDPRALLFCA